MNVLVPIALALYVLAVWLCISRLGGARGVMAALLGGWMFLPVFDGRLDVPVLTMKVTFVSTTVLLVSAAADFRRWQRLALHPVDLVAALVVVLPFATALSNDLGPWEGLSSAIQSFCSWVAPYLLGRVYLGTPRTVREFARWVVGAALIYVPFCLWEIRMSPQLHRQLYGYHTFENFAFAVRWGGYRPTVFMQFGLMVGTFMGTGALVAWWLWRTRAVAKVAGVPMGWCAAALVVTTVLVKSTGAILLLAVGIGVLEATRRLRSPAIVLAVALLPFAFAGARISGWSGSELTEAAGAIHAERGESVSFRLYQEQRLLEKASERPWLGWGRFGRARVYDEDGRDLSVTDSLWIIILGTSGILGLSALGLLLLLPTFLLLRRFPARRWGHPVLAPAAALSLSTALWVVDCLLNAMVIPTFLAMSGATVTFLAGRWSRRRRPAPARARAEGLPPAVPA